MFDQIEQGATRTLPIFPLPLVLMPGEALPLHIFEDRYRLMLVDIAETDDRFGISFLDMSETDDDRPEPGSVGCIAEVRESAMLDDGRSNISTFGIERYRIVRYLDDGKPYNVAEVEPIYDEDEPDGETIELAASAYELFGRVVKAALKLSGKEGPLPDLPKAEPEMLSFLIAAAFNFENELKYRMLASTSTKERLTEICETLERSVSQIEENADLHTAAKSNGHSKKKIGL